MDEKYADKRNSIKSKNFIMYHGSNGGIYDGGAFVKADGTGFKQGEKVKMRVNPI